VLAVSGNLRELEKKAKFGENQAKTIANFNSQVLDFTTFVSLNERNTTKTET